MKFELFAVFELFQLFFKNFLNIWILKFALSYGISTLKIALSYGVSTLLFMQLPKTVSDTALIQGDAFALNVLVV